MSDLSQNDATPKAHGSDPERKRNPSSTPSDPSMQPGLEVVPASGNDKQLISDADEGDKEVVSVEDSEAPHSDKKSYAPLAQSDWLTAWDGDLVGLSACESAINESVPIRLFYASNSTAFEEYLWWAAEDKWEWRQTRQGYSGSANVGCHPGIGYYRYLGLANPSNRLEIWYQPAEDILAEWQKYHSSHPQFEIPNVHPASSLAFRRGYVFYQENATNAMKVVPVRWDGYYKNSRSDDVDSPAADLSGVSATHMDAKRSENYTRISYQRNGGDVAWLERGPGDDKWKVKSPVPIS
ncbi:hypothetical protein MBLNU13_g08033t1 [Cladosporium sp. NU13]